MDAFLKAKVEIIEGHQQEFEVEFEGVGDPIPEPLDSLVEHVLVCCILCILLMKTMSRKPRFLDASLYELFFSQFPSET